MSDQPRIPTGPDQTAARPAKLLDAAASAWSIDHISAVTLVVLVDAPFTTMRAGESVIDLRRAPTTAGHSWERVILRVCGVDALHQDLLEKSFTPTDVKDAKWGERYFELADPQGHVIRGLPE